MTMLYENNLQWIKFYGILRRYDWFMPQSIAILWEIFVMSWDVAALPFPLRKRGSNGDKKNALNSVSSELSC